MSLIVCRSLFVHSVIRPCISKRCWRATVVSTPRRRRVFSSSALEESTSITHTTPSPSLEAHSLVRHGTGDGVVTLNVGGTEFITLRSTLQCNPILKSRVLKAEANQEFTKGAVFIDRDPSQFGLILQHLRNRADELSSASHYYTPKESSSSFWKKKNEMMKVMIQIPQDRAKLRDLFVEARYFQIKELEDVLCSYDIYTRLASFMGGGKGNPFHLASEAANMARRALLATGGIGVVMGSQNEDMGKDMKGLMGDFMSLVTGRKREESKSTSTPSLPPAEPSFS